jgi:hypothetical protein
MAGDLPVFVNARAVRLPAGSRVRDAIRLAEPELLPLCESGEATLTDGRGLPVVLQDAVTAGAILRVARASRRGPVEQADGVG